jgi:regulator of sigma E protease
MSVLILIIGIILFTLLIITHEFGHFIMAKRNGVEVEEFGLFFPPSLYRHKTKGGWVFSINAIPVGGFVKLKGEHDSDTEPGTYGAASLWAKTQIMAAGVVVNLITAVILLIILSLIGLPELIPNQYHYKNGTRTVSQRVLVGDVESGSPAQKSGLKDQDFINSIGPVGGKQTPINTISSLQVAAKKYAGDKVSINYTRGGKDYVGKTTLLSSSVVTASQNAYTKRISNTKLDCASVALPKGYIGVSLTQYALQKSTWAAPINAAGLTVQAAALTFQGLGHAIGGLGSLIAGAVTGNSTARSNGQCNASSEVSGPVGIFVILKNGSQLGFSFMLFIIAIIALTLAIMNILPIPALDGGRLWLTLFMHAIKRPLTAKREEAINATGFIILFSLFILITIVDVKRFL